ncbi:unnamed protein product [Toxocara canis]|uniref:DUF2382 domain-containing protein n=1 Tax=Toxocara canis TaxID=6265 RepID=A0A183U6T3_TOXCA|nr:unnamed protein product [Toxocara canis]
MLGAQQVTVEQVVLNDYAGKCTIIETIEVRADKSTAIANHELIPLVHPLSKASNKERTRAPVVHNEIITIGENVIKIVRQIEIDNQKSAVPIIWNQVHRYDLKNIRRDHSGHSMQLCGIR